MTLLIIVLLQSLIHKDFGVQTYENTPFELLTFNIVKIDNSHELINDQKFDLLSKKMSKSLPLIVKQTILDAENYAEKHSKTKDEFIENFYYHILEKSLIMKFYQKNINFYVGIIKNKYDAETYKYYKRDYNDFNSIRAILYDYWLGVVDAKYARYLGLNPRYPNENLIRIMNDKGLMFINEQVLYFLSDKFRKLVDA